MLAAITLDYSAPPECPGVSVVETEVRRLLGDAADLGESLAASGVVRVDAEGGYRLRLTLRRTSSESRRELASPSCETLAETAALLISLAHDPAEVERTLADPNQATPELAPQIWPPTGQVAPAPSTSGPPLLPAPLLPMPAPPTPMPADRGSDLGLVLRAGPLFGVADLPRAHAGLSVGAGLRIAEYRIEGDFELGVGATGTVDARPNAGADFQRMVGVLLGCRALVPFFDGSWPLAPLDLRFDACVGAELGVLEAQGFGVTRPQQGSAIWFAPRLDARLGLGLVGPLSLQADVGIAFAATPARFVIRGDDAATILVVHEPGPVAGRAGVALELSF